jgi:hypothetical protein
VLYSSILSGASVVIYDLLFLSLADGSFIKQFKISSNRFGKFFLGMLYFYNSKVFFLPYDDDNNGIGLYIWNEGDIASINPGSSLTLSYLQDTNNFSQTYFAKGSASSNYIVLSILKGSLAIIFMLEPATIAGPLNTFNELWRLRVFNSGGFIKTMDTVDSSVPDNRYIFGCADSNGNTYNV